MFLSSEEFMKLAKAKVYEMALASLCPTDDLSTFTINDVYIVTHAFILKNQKAMVSTTLKDGKYYEVTYNEAKSEMYVDQYVKVQNKTYSFMELMSKTEPVKNDEVNVDVQPLYGCPIPSSKQNISGAEFGDLGAFSTPKPRIYTGAESDEPGILQYNATYPVDNEDRVSLDDFVKHVKHEHPDYFPDDEKFESNEHMWYDGIRRDIVKRALSIHGESSFAILIDADNQTLQDIMYFHINAFKNYADFVSVGKLTHDDLFRHVVKTLYRTDLKLENSHETLWTEQIAAMLGISRKKVTNFIMD